MQAIPLSNTSCSPPRIFLHPKEMPRYEAEMPELVSEPAKAQGAQHLLKHLADTSQVHISQMQDWGTISAPPCPETVLVWGEGNALPLNLLHEDIQSFWNILLVSTAETTLSCSLIQPAYILTVPLKLISPPLAQHPQVHRQIKFSLSFLLLGLFIKVRLKQHLIALSQLCIEIRNTNPDNGLQPAAKNGLSEFLGQNEKCHFSVSEIGFVLSKNTWDGAASAIYVLSMTKTWREGFAKDSATFLICLRAGKS